VQAERYWLYNFAVKRKCVWTRGHRGAPTEKSSISADYRFS
jgi:hypothetical protein